MSDNPVYKKVEIVGTSQVGVDDAIKTAVARAATTLRNMSWFEVGEIRGSIKDGSVQQFQVTLSVGFRLDKPTP